MTIYGANPYLIAISMWTCGSLAFFAAVFFTNFRFWLTALMWLCGAIVGFAVYVLLHELGTR